MDEKKKTRLHDLAKRYGMPGKDLAAKLRDFGFSQAKSHMSALDSFEVLQAEGILEANGITPVVAQADVASSAALGGLKVKKKSKKKKKAATRKVEPVVEVEQAPHETAAGAELAPKTEAGTEAEIGAGEVAAPTEAGEGDPATAEVPEAPADDTVPAATEETEERVPALAPDQPEPTETTGGAPLEVPAEPAPAGAETVTLPEKGEAEPVEVAAEMETAAAKAAVGPKGNVVGFIDPESFKRAEPKRKSETRRLQSRDDFTPDVRPTFTHGGKGGRGGSGPRGKLTAAELREREQGRFLRRAGRPGGGPGGGHRGRGGPVSPRREETSGSPLAGGKVNVEAPVTISKLAEALKLKSAVVIKRSIEEKFGMFTLNSLLDDDTATLLGQSFNVELVVRHEISAEEAHLDEVRKKRNEVEEGQLVLRPPTVAFLGHVDHGKTTLIDKIRETAVAEHEAGGITQHIGAYQVRSSKGNVATIVDTPGHQAFTAMRARGAKAVDIVVLVVAGDDGVMPSTEEAVNHARAAGTPIVVAINKKDKPGFNANSTIQQLMGLELTPEQYGGKTAMFETSGLTGEGIDELLEHLHLMGEVELDLRAHPSGPAGGVVLEAEIEQGRGIVAHLLVQDGTLNKGDVILAGEGYGKVKSIHDDRGETIESAGPSSPIEVTGLAALPGVGAPFHVIETLEKAKEIATERERKNRAMSLAASREPRRDLQAILGSSPKVEIDFINLIVRADVQGSAEVIRHEVEKLKHEEVEVRLVHSGVGPITESDIDLAATSEALVVAFHVGVNGKARQEADRYGIDIRRYDVIYELLDDLRGLMEGALSPEFEEVILGHAEIRRIFKSSRIGLIAGCYVLDGKVTRRAKVRLLRDDKVVHSGDFASLRRESDDAKDVREGFECGIVLEDYSDIQEGDIIEAYTLKEVKRTLEGGR